MQKILISIILLAVLSLGSACTMYRYPVQQGNLFTQEMVQQLHVGMTASQVLAIMGTPLVKDGFNHQRWTYYYRYTDNGQLIHEYKIRLLFDNRGRLQSIQGKAPSYAELHKER